MVVVVVEVVLEAVTGVAVLLPATVGAVLETLLVAAEDTAEDGDGGIIGGV